jgi:hypothetical protein
MKKKNYIVMIVCLILTEILTFSYFAIREGFLEFMFNKPIIPTLIFVVICVIGYIIYCCLRIKGKDKNKKLELAIIATIVIITVIKVITCIPLFGLNKNIDTMKNINQNYDKYTSFEEVIKENNISENDFKDKTVYFPYIENFYARDWIKDFYVDRIIREGKDNYNNSYSKMLNEFKKKNIKGIYPEYWINHAEDNINQVVKDEIGLLIITIVIELIIIGVPMIKRRLN